MFFIPLFALSISSSGACRPSNERASPAQLLDRVASTIGLASVSDRVLITQSTRTILENGQSDRSYPPFYLTTQRASALSSPLEKAMDPWAVLSEWRRDASVTLVGECSYRDYWRVVLSRNVSGIVERLFIDSKTWFPLKLDRKEEHPILGDVIASYVWSLWTPIDAAYSPGAVFRLIDGTTVETRMVDHMSLAPPDSASRIPDRSANPQLSVVDPVPDTIRLGPATFALYTPAYTNVVSLVRDTVFILDAQTSENRARRDSAWIATLFPGRHPHVLIVTDLAWPHIAGVRFWAAHGATILTHRASVAFLHEVLERRWTIKPDELERYRIKIPRIRIVSIDTSATRARGLVEIRAIDGVDSEGALMVYLTAERTLYAGDFIQPARPGSFAISYAREVASAVSRNGFAPLRFVSMHVRPQEWSRITSFTFQD